MNIKIGTRKSRLAMAQTEAITEALKNRFPSDTFEIVGISTTGDRDTKTELQKFSGKGIFIKEIEAALLRGEIDMAVHSAKDMPTMICDGLEISAVLLRADRRDVLVSLSDITAISAPVIGTGSVRREMQAKKLFKNAVFKPIRGNIDTRLAKVKSGEYDAVIMAKAAIDRLGITDFVVSDLGDNFICAAAQGIIAVETVKDKMKQYTNAINDAKVMTEFIAERAFLKYTGGGCHAPCGASAVFDGDKTVMKTFFGDTKKCVCLEMSGSDPEKLGKEMALITLAQMEGK